MSKINFKNIGIEALKNKYLMTSIIFSISAIVFAWLHADIGWQNGVLYTKSIYIHFEMISVLVVAIFLVASPFICLYNLVKKQWLDAGFSLIAGIICLIGFMVAANIDAPTIIYMT